MTDQIGHIPPTIDEIIIDTELLPPECSRVKIGRITDKPELKICIEVDDPIEKTRLHGFETTDAAQFHLVKKFNYQLTGDFNMATNPPATDDNPRFVLSDDGTLDTVILDTKTNQEHRFNFQNTEADDDYTYDQFVAWCIEELENDPDIPE